MRGWSKSAWTGALLLSLLVHGGAAAFLAGREDEIRIAGGSPVDIAILGNSFEDSVSAGEISDIADPVAVAAGAEISDEPVPAQQAEAVSAEPVPIEAEAVTSAAEPVEAETGAVAEAEVPAMAGSVHIPSAAVSRADETVAELADVAEPELARPTTEEAVPASEAETAEPARSAETVNPIADVPIPRPRPDFEAMRAEQERREAERREQAQRRQAASRQEAPPRQQARPAAGAGGASQADARRGDAAGSAQGRSAQSSGQGSQACAPGNAAVSNYPGQVVSRLRRSLSYPAQARRQRITGEVHVAFTVAGNGAVSGVRIVRGSGHAVLDEAALQTVHRAAPFPAIPREAGLSNWSFTVPLAFTR